MKTPFDEIIIQLGTYFMQNPAGPNKLPTLIHTHLQMLRNIYLRLIETDFFIKSISFPQGTRTLSAEESFLEIPQDSYRVNLDYLQLIFILNQFGRALNNSKFPNFHRIKFYRNCVGEHWDEYTPTIKARGFRFTRFKAPIPVVEELWIQKERHKLKKRVALEFLKIGIKMHIPNKFLLNMMSSEKVYSEYFFRRLEKINPKLYTKFRSGAIPRSLVKLLFKFGFPTPITDVEDYSDKLIIFLKEILKKEGVILPTG